MAYKTYPTSKAKTLIDSYKQKKVDAKAVATQIKADMNGIQSNYGVHTTAVEKAHTRIAKALRDTKQAFAAYKQVPQQGPLDAMVECLNDAQITYEESVEDANAFGKSWFEYRTFSPGNLGADKKIADEFGQWRSKLMADSKSVVLKKEAMDQYIKEIELMIKAASTTRGRDIQKARTDAQAFATEIEDLLKEMRDAKGSSKTSFEGNLLRLAGATQQKSVTQVEFATLESLYKNVVSTANMWKTKFSTIETAWKQGNTSFTANEMNDPAVKKSVVSATTFAKEAEGLAMIAKQGVIKAAQDLQAIRQKIK